MAEITANENVTLDGVFEDPENWSGPFQSPDMFEFIGKGMQSENALLFGRKTYEKFVTFWPNSDMEPFASKMNKSRRFVVSTTLEHAPWGDWDPCTVINGNVPDTIAGLKRQSSQDFVILGSGQLVRTLIGAGLLDRLDLMVHPLVLGTGKRLFDGDLNASLRLIESHAFSGGVVILGYGPATES